LSGLLPVWAVTVINFAIVGIILVMMPVVAVLLRRLDTRYLIAFGFLICGMGLLWMSRFNLQVPFQTAMLARIAQSFGLAFLFVPMNVTAFQNVPMDKTSYATGMLNLVRNIGGSTGIALVSTILARRSQLHQANLVGNLHTGSLQYQGFLERSTGLLVHHGSSAADAARQAQGLAYGQLLRQANMMAFADTFWIMGVLCLALLPLLLLMRKTHAGKGPVPAGH
jgi:DHA2 family multidrug resistance protein